MSKDLALITNAIFLKIKLFSTRIYSTKKTTAARNEFRLL